MLLEAMVSRLPVWRNVHGVGKSFVTMLQGGCLRQIMPKNYLIKLCRQFLIVAPGTIIEQAYELVLESTIWDR